MEDRMELSETSGVALTDVDRDLILRQCEIQHATRPEQIEGFTQAYLKAKTLSANVDWETFRPEELLELVLDLGKLTESHDNRNGYATVPRIFANGDRGVEPEFIPKNMDDWAKAYVEDRFSPEEAYLRFEKIHPFVDGNGRVGDLMWKMATQRVTGNWPEALPPDQFADGASKNRVRASAFGEVEE